MFSIGGENPVKSAESNHSRVFIAEALIRPIEAVAFWAAIVLPFLYIPLLFYGLETAGELTVFFALLGLNIVAIVLGNRYNRS